MNASRRIASCLVILAGLSVGCTAANHSHVEDHWGESYRTLKAQQIANPEAGNELKTVEGMNSTTAAGVTSTYHSRQTEQPQTQQDSSLLELIGE